ncbi:MAG TPA: CoA-binding protein [Anaerolineaceae bacterium]|nr:CoA-binding protein [Anaerolineaceae bacterium]
MTTKVVVQEFLSQKTLAIAGVSRDTNKFGNMVYKHMKARGYQVYAINPNAESIDGDPCYASLAALPQPVDGVVAVLTPDRTEKLVEEAAAAGVKHIWMQQGAESPAAIQFCQDHGIHEVHGECLIMYASPSFPHSMHTFVWKLIGKAAS